MVRNSNKMETTFYDEYSYGHHMDVNQLKRSLTLDLGGSRAVKKIKLNSDVITLNSPDLNMVKLSSPELEKFIIDQNVIGASTPTPTSQILFPKNVTEEQEIYARGFVEALNELHHSDSSQGHQPSNDSTRFMSLDTVIVKDEPQTVPNISCSTPPLSPIDMECQERIKLERKRLRNRVAASKCRKRKLERIALLEDKVKSLKGENAELGQVVHKLKEQVYRLKEQVMDHVNSGCRILVNQPL